MIFQQKYMARCLELAKRGLRYAMPNPSVGAVIVHNDQIIGEGFTSSYGGSHAEVNAINSVKQRELLENSTLYVSLEPCSHLGKTPPCADLIIEKKIPNVVIGAKDTNITVSGKGIEKLKNSGCNIHLGLMEKECREINKRFFTFHEKKRPYIILKWAQSLDGFLDAHRKAPKQKPVRITCEQTNTMVHYWRSEEAAIMIGSNTAIMDNPELTVRHVEGISPVRIVLDRNLNLSCHLNLFDQKVKTLVYTSKKKKNQQNLEYVSLDFSENILTQVLADLYDKNILSVIVEGGSILINAFINDNLWDEARMLVGDEIIGQGIPRPSIQREPELITNIGSDKLIIFRNA